jgi:hypothetical protein
MSSNVYLSNIDDYLAPSQACINPLFTTDKDKGKDKGTSGKEGGEGEGEEKKENETTTTSTNAAADAVVLRQRHRRKRVVSCMNLADGADKKIKPPRHPQ